MATTVYALPGDVYATRAKDLLTTKKIAFNEITIKAWGAAGSDKEISLEDLKKLAPDWQRGPVTVLEDGTKVYGLKALQAKLG